MMQRATFNIDFIHQSVLDLKMLDALLISGIVGTTGFILVVVFAVMKLRSTSNESKKGSEKKAKKPVTPSSYTSMPYYFPTEQVDIVRKAKSRRRARRKS
jgi:hypothetical protein